MAADSPKAFFSYSREDLEFALRLAKDLKAAGANVWMDKLDIRPGQRWDGAVEDALSSCPSMLVILSPASVDSTNVMDEVSFALEEQKTVIPVLHLDCKIPFRLRRVQYLDFRNDYDEGLERLIKALLVGDQQQNEAPRRSTAKHASAERKPKRPTRPSTPSPAAVPRQTGTRAKPNMSLFETCILSGHSDMVDGIAVTPDGRLAVSASWDKTLKVWDLVGGRELRTLRGHTDPIRGVALTSDGKLTVSASEDKTLKVWDLGSGRELRTLRGHTAPIRGVALSSDGKLAVSASEDKTLKVWDLGSGRELRTLSGHADYVNAVAMTSDGKLAVSACEDKSLKIWEIVSGHELRAMSGHKGGVSAVVVTPDGRTVLSASYGDLKLWDMRSGRELRDLRGHSSVRFIWAKTGEFGSSVACHSGWIGAVAVTPDGELAVSASEDKTLKVWELASGLELSSFAADYQLHCCAVGPDGNTVVAGDDEGNIHYLRLEPAD